MNKSNKAGYSRESWLSIHGTESLIPVPAHNLLRLVPLLYVRMLLFVHKLEVVTGNA